MNEQDRQALTEGAVKITRGVVELARTTAELLGSARAAAEESRVYKTELLASVLSSLSPWLGSVLGILDHSLAVAPIEDVKKGAAILIGTRQSSSLYLAAEATASGLRPVLIEKKIEEPSRADRGLMVSRLPRYSELSAAEAIAAGWYLEAILSEIARRLTDRLGGAAESSARLEDLTDRLRLTIKTLWR